MHDAKAGQKRSTNANDVGDDNQTPTSVDVPLEIQGDIAQAQKFSEAFFHKDDLGGIRRDGRSAAQRNGDVRFFQRDRIVNTVTDEADGSPLLLQKLDVFGLILRQNFGKIAVHSQFVSQIASRSIVVAGDDGQMLGAAFSQSVDDLQRFG